MKKEKSIANFYRAEMKFQTKNKTNNIQIVRKEFSKRLGILTTLIWSDKFW